MRDLCFWGLCRAHVGLALQGAYSVPVEYLEIEIQDQVRRDDRKADRNAGKRRDPGRPGQSHLHCAGHGHPVPTPSGARGSGGAFPRRHEEDRRLVRIACALRRQRGPIGRGPVVPRVPGDDGGPGTPRLLLLLASKGTRTRPRRGHRSTHPAAFMSGPAPSVPVATTPARTGPAGRSTLTSPPG